MYSTGRGGAAFFFDLKASNYSFIHFQKSQAAIWTLDLRIEARYRTIHGLDCSATVIIPFQKSRFVGMRVLVQTLQFMLQKINSWAWIRTLNLEHDYNDWVTL